jgi:hypothetical protein
MTFKNDTRGVSEVVGAILVFGVLVALLAIMQTQAVPAANQQVEFEHTQDAQGDLIKFHQSASQVANTGDGQSVSIETGTGYPTRMLFYNPPRVQGSLSTSENRTVTIQNAEATQPEVNDYLNGSNVTLDTRTFRYDVSYNELQNAPQVRYEYGVLYNQFEDDTTIQNPGSVIDDTDINLVFMMGDYSRTSGDTQSLDVRPVSAPARPVTIEGQNGNNITLELPTDLPVSDWRELYGDQDHVTIQNGTAETVEIILDGDRRYTLKMAGLGLEQGVDKPDAHYIVPAEDGITSIGAGQNATVSYEVRDEYNNPVSGVNVTIDLPNGPVTKATDGRGRVSAEITADSRVAVPAEVEPSQCSAGARCEADYVVQVASLNPNPSTGVTLVNASADSTEVPLLDASIDDDQLAFTLESDSGSVRMEKFRINHYHSDSEAHSPASLDDENSSTATVDDIEIGGDFVDANDGVDDLDPVESDGTTYILTFQEGVEPGDYVVLTIVYENNERSLYFASA